uniref:RRM domain-containing protein n=1 Tax=Rhabditophanes sp. KR3021 TaxID=114890 RepID=A0AC35TT85_9BILA
MDDEDLFDMAIAPSATTAAAAAAHQHSNVAKQQQPAGYTSTSTIITAPPPKQVEDQSTGKRFCCYISNLTWWTTDADLNEFIVLQGCESPIDIKFHENKINGQSKGFALIVFRSESDVKTLTENASNANIHGRNPQILPYTKTNFNKLDEANKRPEIKKKDGNENKPMPSASNMIPGVNLSGGMVQSNQMINTNILNNGRLNNGMMQSNMSALPTVNLAAKPIYHQAQTYQMQQPQQTTISFGSAGMMRTAANGPPGMLNTGRANQLGPPGIMPLMSQYNAPPGFLPQQTRQVYPNYAGMTKEVDQVGQVYEECKNICVGAVNKAKQEVHNDDPDEALRTLRKAYDYIKRMELSQCRDMVNTLYIINAVRDCKDKGKTLERLWTCAANKHDHTKCCTNHGVPPICLNYCAAHNGPPVSVGAELLCLGFIDQIRKCFRVHLEHNPLYLSKGKN